MFKLIQKKIFLGSTPSKRMYIYPRILAATSPHENIVKRYREENNWSDLDTTATIDEEVNINYLLF